MPPTIDNQGPVPCRRVFLPDILASFSCDMCGECCSAWEIPVDRDSYDRVVAALGEAAAERLVVVNPLSRRDYARLKLLDGRCGFQQGSLCSIHRNHGEGLLFPECRKFPRVLFSTPLAIHATASFACSKMLASLDRPERVRPLHVTARDVPFAPELCDTAIEGPPCLRRGTALTWEAFFAIEHAFLEMLAQAGRPIEVRLLTMVEFVRSLGRDDEVPVQKATVDRELQTARIDGFHELGDRFLFLSDGVEPQLRFVLELLRLRIEAGLARSWERLPLTAAYSRWASLPEGRRLARFVEDHRRCGGSFEGRTGRILENYLVCRLAGNPEFVLADVETGLGTVVALYALARAVAVAAAAGGELTPRTMLESIRAVDTAFFHLPDFGELVRGRRVEAAALLAPC